MRLNAGDETELKLPDGFTTLLLVLKGSVLVNGSEAAGVAELALFERAGEFVTLKAREDSAVLVMNGQPIDEPIAGHGPFVMNTQEEISQAIADFGAGRF